MSNNVITVNVSNDVSAVLVSDTGLRGKPGIVWRGEFSATVNYYLGDVVSFQGSSYIATVYSVASAATPNTSANFSTLAVKGEAGGAGVVAYVLPDSVVHDTETIDGGDY
tara:strand:- start:353 stop:682 length:330 start_codon:yes stop_codon:yes gene_type:complete